MNTAIGLLGTALMALSKMAASYEMLIIGRLIVGFNCGQYILTYLPTLLGHALLPNRAHLDTLCLTTHPVMH